MNKRDSYLLEALLELAAIHPAPLTVAAIARRRGLPAGFLARLLAAAARRGVVATSRGPRGGVQLVRPPAATALAAVIAPAPATVAGGDATRWLAGELERCQRAALASLTLADLAAREREAGAFSFAI